MVGEPYIAYVKQRLNDQPSAQVQLGEYYSWQVILQFLNEALLHILHIALKNNVLLPLRNLYRQIVYGPPPPAWPGGYPLPANFLWPLSAQLVHSATGATVDARLLIGGSGLSYAFSGDNVCLFLANAVTFIDSTNTVVPGTLNYLVYPSPFSIAQQGRADYTQKDFDDYIYDMAAELAVAFLGAQEGQMLREGAAWEKWWGNLNGVILEALLHRNLSVLHTARLGD